MKSFTVLLSLAYCTFNRNALHSMSTPCLNKIDEYESKMSPPVYHKSTSNLTTESTPTICGFQIKKARHYYDLLDLYDSKSNEDELTNISKQPHMTRMSRDSKFIEQHSWSDDGTGYMGDTESLDCEADQKMFHFDYSTYTKKSERGASCQNINPQTLLTDSFAPNKLTTINFSKVLSKKIDESIQIEVGSKIIYLDQSKLKKYKKCLETVVLSFAVKVLDENTFAKTVFLLSKQSESTEKETDQNNYKERIESVFKNVDWKKYFNCQNVFSFTAFPIQRVFKALSFYKSHKKALYVNKIQTIIAHLLTFQDAERIFEAVHLTPGQIIVNKKMMKYLQRVQNNWALQSIDKNILLVNVETEITSFSYVGLAVCALAKYASHYI